MKHIVDIHVDRCIGCTRCMRACPTEAIRIKNGKAHLLNERCIFCGNCIINCHKSAYKVSGDSFANLNKHKISIVILPISIFGMVTSMEELGGIYQILYNYGFDEVYDLSLVTALLKEKINEFLKRDDKTYILSQCPSVIRLIQLKYPSLLPNLLPFDFPFEIGAKLVRKIASEKYQVKEEDIGISYVSECLSNFIAIKEQLGKSQSSIDNVFLLNDLFRNSIESKDMEIQVAKKGVQFAKVGTFDCMTSLHKVISVDGIKQVDEVLEKVYLNKLTNIKLIEAYSCIGGCVGGNFTLENTYVSKWKINQFCDKIDDGSSDKLVKRYRGLLKDQEWFFENALKPQAPYKLSDDLNQSIIKMNKINEILKQLPNIDCCACGSPSCRALAEDVVNQVKTINDCCMLKKEE
ncbi:4Fe-4S dicluster domain-containing protein [Mycoplasmatota bacterium]|nr:4Fe-4S dicluster domain-containing protein [Mycoplasmatota bacterium]